jgi:hypothetical protein
MGEEEQIESAELQEAWEAVAEEGPAAGDAVAGDAADVPGAGRGGKPLPTDVKPAKVEPELSFEERCDLIERLVLNQTEHRELRLGILDYCRTRRALPEVEYYVMDLPEYGSETQSPYYLVRSLEQAGALLKLELDEEGEVVTSERKEGLTEDEVDDLVFEIDYETTPAGIAVCDDLTPAARLEGLFAMQPARTDTYREVLEFCRTPRTRQELEELLDGREILTLDAPGDRPLKPSVFVDKLERSGVLVWRGKWVTSESGKAYLDEHAAVA